MAQVPGKLVALLLRLEVRANAIIRRRTAHHHWMAVVALAAGLLSLLLTSPSTRAFDPERAGHADTVLEKVAEPWANYTYDGASHASKRQFRLTMPWLMIGLHLGIGGAKALEMLFGLALLLGVAQIGWRATGDRVATTWLTLGAALIFAGFTAFADEETTYDGVALFMLTAACVSRSRIIVAIAISLAAWCDERALVASSLVMLYHLILDRPQGRLTWRSFVSGMSCAIYLAWAGYLAGRWLLISRTGMEMPTGGIGMTTLLSQLQIIPLGLWTAFEGLWLVVAGAWLVLLARREFGVATLFAGGIALVSFAALCVLDISRSLAYALPALFIGVHILGGQMRRHQLRRCLAIAAVLCLMWPPMYVQYSAVATRMGNYAFVQAIDWWEWLSTDG